MNVDVCIKKTYDDFVLDAAFNTDVSTLGILGASGCGKSMTLKCIAGIERPDEGHILLGDRVLFDSEKKIDLKPQERKVGYLFQNYALFPNMTVRQNIMAPLNMSGTKKEEVAGRMIEQFHLKGLEDHLPMQLSGGQQQRAALARMMAVRPSLILLDEPFSALDVFLKDKLMKEFMAQLLEFKSPVIMVSHNIDEVRTLCESTAVMEEGRVERIGETQKVIEDMKKEKGLE